VTFAHVGIHAADRIQPIEIHPRIISASVAGLPIVEYQHAGLADDAPMPTLLFFSGGGCSGAVFALLAEKCLAQGVQGGCVPLVGLPSEWPCPASCDRRDGLALGRIIKHPYRFRLFRFVQKCE
jgi:hypothetical protein